MKKFGFLTSGGDCQSLNATMRGVAKTLYEKYSDVKMYGFLEGYKGLIYGNYRELAPSDFSGILNTGGTMLGTSRVPFKQIDEPTEDGLNKVESMKATYKKLGLDCLIVLGGNGTQKTANRLREEGLNVIHLPKTIDNDIWGTDITFGFHSAIEVATKAIDNIHTTATSHGRVFIVEIMGHKVGWITLYAGIASGADVVLLPEIPYDIKEVTKAIKKRQEAGKKFSILAVAEGAISKEDAKLSKKELKKKQKESTYPSVAYKIADEISKAGDIEVRVAVPGHTQRGGEPTPFDRIVATRLGVEAANLIIKEKYGYMVGYKGDKIVPVKLEDAAGKLKGVDPKCDMIKEAKSLGISFGD